MKKNTLKRLSLLLLLMMITALGVSCTSNGGSSGGSDKDYGLNEAADMKTLKITATEIKESQGNTFLKPDEGNVYVGVKFTIENISKESQTVSSLLLFDAYVDDVKASISFSAAAAFDGSGLDGSLEPGKKMEGYYAVEAKSDWKNIQLDVKSSWLGSNKAKFVIAKP